MICLVSLTKALFQVNDPREDALAAVAVERCALVQGVRSGLNLLSAYRDISFIRQIIRGPQLTFGQRSISPLSCLLLHFSKLSKSFMFHFFPFIRLHESMVISMINIYVDYAFASCFDSCALDKRIDR